MSRVTDHPFRWASAGLFAVGLAGCGDARDASREDQADAPSVDPPSTRTRPGTPPRADAAPSRVRPRDLAAGAGLGATVRAERAKAEARAEARASEAKLRELDARLETLHQERADALAELERLDNQLAEALAAE